MAELREPEPVVYEFTHDPGLLLQYYQLRGRMFFSVWGLNFDGSRNEYDDVSDILIARSGKLCVGGVRLTYSSPEIPIDLPMEHDDFCLKKLFPALALDNKSYAECTRVALLPEFRTKEVSTTLRSRVILRNPQKQVSYCLWVDRCR